MTIPDFEEIVEQNDQTEARRDHLDKLRELVGNVYPSKFARSSVSGGEDTISRLLNFEPIVAAGDEMAAIKASLKEGERPPAEAKENLNGQLKAFGTVRIAGRLTTPPRGNFVHLTDGIGKFQIYCDKKGGFALIKNDGADTVDPEGGWTAWKLIDHGDFVGVEGYLFVTNTGEVSLHVEKLQFLAKAMVPMPDKMHGIADPEIRQRQRYADLIASSLQVKSEPPASAGGQDLTTREVFEIRAKVISSLRRYLEDHGYIEVETPMLTPKATGAAAKPFVTHHNALDIELYARIAPELYLKRLVVGGFEKVYELNRNFRNEGISFKHNPEFTMLEFYCAYMDVNGMMDFCEAMIKESIQRATGGLKVTYEGNEIDFGNFERVAMSDAVGTLTPSSASERADDGLRVPLVMSDSELLTEFENHIEEKLIQPTFIIDYPKSISPLSKASPENPALAERFELFINGMEVANGFSELNDPKEQYDRFVDQMSERERGDEEAMELDEDYVRALSYGMPPAAGIGIGIDRLVMLLTNKHSIRDVILFPHLRPERKAVEDEPAS
ncbi:MAG: lysine--tRNA ligase [Pyrinomonadaceae bacterium]